MSDRDGDESAAIWRRPSAFQVALVSTIAMTGVALVVPVPDGSRLAAATVGLVLAEALALYVGYGALIRVAGPTTRGVLVE